MDGAENLELLRDIRQRHGDALDVATKDFEDRREEVQAVLLSISQVKMLHVAVALNMLIANQTNGAADATLASMDTQDTVRAAAILDIYKRLEQASADDKVQIQSTHFDFLVSHLA